MVPVRALAEHFRGRFLHLARRALPGVRLPEIPWSKRWVVFAKPVARSSTVLDYLGRYVHRTALSDKAITACDERSVTFAYRDSSDGRRKTMTLPAHEFLRRFLQHVPLRGLLRVRAFGLLHPSHRPVLHRLQLLLARPAARHADPTVSPRPQPQCPHCHTPTLRRVRRLSPLDCLAFEATAQAPPPDAIFARERGPPNPPPEHQ